MPLSCAGIGATQCRRLIEWQRRRHSLIDCVSAGLFLTGAALNLSQNISCFNEIFEAYFISFN